MSRGPVVGGLIDRGPVFRGRIDVVSVLQQNGGKVAKEFTKKFNRGSLSNESRKIRLTQSAYSNFRKLLTLPRSNFCIGIKKTILNISEISPERNC